MPETQQLTSLFDVPHSHRHDPMSSYRAGDKVARSGKLRGQMATVLRAVTAYPNTTSAEMARYYGLDRYMPARRLKSLERRGYVIRGPERRCRVCGAPCDTWRPAKEPDLFGGGVER